MRIGHPLVPYDRRSFRIWRDRDAGVTAGDESSESGGPAESRLWRPDWTSAPAQPVLADGACDLWRIDLEAVAAAGGGDPAISPLDAAERARAARFVFERHRRWYTAARTALRAIVGAYLEIEPVAVPIEIEPLGRPRLGALGPAVVVTVTTAAMGPATATATAAVTAASVATASMMSAEAATVPPLDFNLSHCDALAVLAVARRGPLGVDVERVREMKDALALAQRHFVGDEIGRVASATGAARDAAFFTCWTRKEAVLKSTGVGLTVSTRSVHVGATPESRTLDFRSKESVVPLVLHSFEVRDGAFGACAVAPAVTRLAFHDFGPGLG